MTFNIDSTTAIPAVQLISEYNETGYNILSIYTPIFVAFFSNGSDPAVFEFEPCTTKFENVNGIESQFNVSNWGEPITTPWLCPKVDNWAVNGYYSQ
jgi:hypothetical protein